jgi:two-component system LytT family response regulator
MSLRVVIADDESLVRKSIRRFLRDHDVEIVEDCEDGISALEAIRSKSPDLVFLDIQMPELTGMGVLEAIGEEKIPAIVIITAHANFAVDAYEFNVVDYLLKPFGKERFEKALSRVRQRIGVADDQLAENSPTKGKRVEKLLEHLLQQYEYVDRIPVPRNGRVFLVETRRIEWIEAKGNLLLLHCDGETYELRKPLSMLQKQLDPRSFIRIHRSTIVNVRFVREIQPWFNGHHIVMLKSGQQLRMSRYRHEGIQRLMGSSSD